MEKGFQSADIVLLWYLLIVCCGCCCNMGNLIELFFVYTYILFCSVWYSLELFWVIVARFQYKLFCIVA